MKFIILYVLCVLLSRSYSENNSENDESVSVCKTFLKTNPKPYSIDFRKLNDYEDFGMFERRDGKYKLMNAIKFHKMLAIEEGDVTTSVCTSIVDTTSYTSVSEYQGFAAWVTFNTRTNISTAIVNVTTTCWRKENKLTNCNPVFMPLPGLMDTALFNFSPLNEEFWNHVQDETLFARNWVWRMNFWTNYANIHSSWVSKLTITSLWELQIIGNDWGKPETLLGPLPGLKSLDLTRNNIEILPNGTLDNARGLQKIILGHNNISRMPSGVANLEDIYVLDLTNPIGNATLTITDDDIPALRKVHILGLERTKLITNASALLNLTNLRFLNMSGCFLNFINDADSRPPKMISEIELLDLSFNNISALPMNIFYSFTNLKYLYLHDNLFEICPNDSLNSVINLRELHFAKNLFSTLESNCFSRLYELVILDLSGNNLMSLGATLFQNLIKLKQLDLSHNQLTTISHIEFSSLKVLENLYISNNRLIESPSLPEAKFKIVDLSNNNIRSIVTSAEFVEYLDLSNNVISTLKVENVSSLNLSYNSLTNISKEVWENLANLESLDLGGNDFKCCHSDTIILQEKINGSQGVINNLYDGRPFTCSIDTQKILLNTFLYNATICTDDTAWGVPLIWEIVVPFILMGALVSFIIAALYFYRTELTYISHLFKMKKRGWENDEERYNICCYDAFVCYSGKNFQWIAHQLLPNLENGSDGYRLCMHDRDFTLGAAIDRNIIVSLEKSRKVIFVLSQDFITSRWCQWELEMANHKMFEENRSYIILIELERMDKKSMPRHLRYLMDTRTYLEWPEDTADERVQRCWKRLRNALGDSIQKRTGRLPPKCSVLDS